EVADAHDIVPLEHAPGLVPGHLHRHALGNPGADEIADRRSAEVVTDTTRASSLHTGRSECDPEALDGPARTVEHARTDDLELPGQILGDRSLLLKDFAQLTRHRQRAALPVLRLPRIEPHFPGIEVHLAPLERQDLVVDPPASQVGEGRSRAYGFRQMRSRGANRDLRSDPRYFVPTWASEVCGSLGCCRFVRGARSWTVPRAVLERRKAGQPCERSPERRRIGVTALLSDRANRGVVG